MSEQINFSSLASTYKVFVFDVFGVIHNGIEAYPRVIETLQNLALAQEIIFLSNNPRPQETTRQKIISLGLTRPFQVLTSGDVTQHLLKTEYQGQKIYHWGRERNTEIATGLDLNLVETLEKCDLVLLTAFLEQDETEEESEKKIERIIRSQKPVLCANPDRVAAYGNTVRRCAGHFAAKIQARGGKVQIVGKPDPLIYEMMLKNYPVVDSSRMLMIGDTLETDIIGAKRVGMDQYLVLTGNTGDELRKHDLTLEQYLKKQGLENYAPTFYGSTL